MRTDVILMLQFGFKISNNAPCVPEQPLDKVMLKATAADNEYNSPSLIDWDVIVQEFQLGACLHDRFCRPFHPSLLLTIAIHEDIMASNINNVTPLNYPAKINLPPLSVIGHPNLLDRRNSCTPTNTHHYHRTMVINT